MRTPEARPISPQEQTTVHSPVVDFVYGRLRARDALIVGERVATGELDNFITHGRILQTVKFYVAPKIPAYETGSQEEYADKIATLQQTTIKDLQAALNSSHRKEIHHSSIPIWPVSRGDGIGEGALLLDEKLGYESKTSKITITEVRPGSLSEIGTKPEESTSDTITTLVRRVIVEIFPHPLVALLAPRMRDIGIQDLEGIGLETTVDSIIDIQGNGVSSKPVRVALARGFVAPRELEKIFGSVNL